MGTLDQVMQLKQQGYDDQQISASLGEQGVSPKEITDAINQAQIKNAVADSGDQAVPGQDTGLPSEAPAPEAGGAESYYTPQTQEVGDPYAQQPQAGAYAQQPAGGEYYEEGAYPQQTGATTGIDSDTIIEIANQVFSEKIKKLQTQVEDITELKTIMQVKVDSIDTRLKRMEKMIDTLQIKVLEKVGSFGRELSATKKEVAMVENSLSKIVKSKAKPTTKKTISRKRK